MTSSSHLHLQHLLENGLGQAFPGLSLVAPLDQLVFVLLVGNNASAAGDLTVTITTTTTTRLTGVSVSRNSLFENTRTQKRLAKNITAKPGAPCPSEVLDFKTSIDMEQRD